MSKRKDSDTKSTLTTTQEVLYSSEFKRADKAGGYTQDNAEENNLPITKYEINFKGGFYYGTRRSTKNKR
ncbi:YfhE family protein [Bacillus sp. FSL K6-3431]|uniref:YfhE family protein n=1 Tax=Bacillus sp. FSL K6-3431 TaxID=2921500 RepID=UPI0030FA35E6